MNGIYLVAILFHISCFISGAFMRRFNENFSQTMGKCHRYYSFCTLSAQCLLNDYYYCEFILFSSQFRQTISLFGFTFPCPRTLKWDGHTRTASSSSHAAALLIEKKALHFMCPLLCFFFSLFHCFKFSTTTHKHFSQALKPAKNES